jgi:tRNA(fMet)-specific endonuclease VapC
MKILDTNICIYLINKNPEPVLNRLSQHAVEEIALSSITVAELVFGIEKSQSKKNRSALEQFLMPFQILDFDYRSAWTSRGQEWAPWIS